MTGWEYLIISLPVFRAARSTQGQSAAVDVLNQEGAAGWEAVGIITLADASIAVLLKRPRTDDEEESGGEPDEDRVS